MQLYYSHCYKKITLKKARGHGILCPPVWKSGGDTYPVSPTELHPWIKAWHPNKNLHFHFGCHLCKINVHTAILRMFPHIFPNFLTFCPNFRGFCPDFYQFKFLGCHCNPSVPASYTSGCAVAKASCTIKSIFIQWRTFLEGTLNQSLETSSTKNLYQCYLKPTFQMLQICHLCP